MKAIGLGKKPLVRPGEEEGNRFPDPLLAWNGNVDGDNMATAGQFGGDEEFSRGAGSTPDGPEGESQEENVVKDQGPLPYERKDCSYNLAKP